MIKEERHARICDYLEKHQFAAINTLMEYVGASKSTIRRDLQELREAQKIEFVRGGASSINKRIAPESPYQVKQNMNAAEKERIGKAAAQMIHEGETVYLAGGTTTKAMLPYLDQVAQLNLVTNDIIIGMDVADRENISLTMTGGTLRPKYYALRGILAEDSMRAMKIGMAFLSCDAIDVQSGCYIANADEVGLLRQVIESSNYVILLADHSKFYSSAFISFCTMAQVDMVISDTGLNEEIRAALRKKNIKLVLA